MKNILIYSVLVAVSLQSRIFADDAKSYEWGALTNKVQMSISLVNGSNEIKLGEPVNLLIQFGNITTNETFLAHYSNGGGPCQGLSFVITDPSNTDVSPVYPKGYQAFSFAHFRVPPNQTNGFKFNLDSLCNSGFLQRFDKIGTYKILAMQEGQFVGTNQVFFTVISNPLYVTAVPDKR
jgi:hypothetical protein